MHIIILYCVQLGTGKLIKKGVGSLQTTINL